MVSLVIFSQTRTEVLAQSNAINLSVSQNIDGGLLCPNCLINWDNGYNCFYYDVTAATIPTTFQAHFLNPTNPNDVNWVWMYQDDNSGVWKSFDNDENPTGALGHINNVFTVGDNNTTVVRFRVCITHIGASNNESQGIESYDYLVAVDLYP